MKIYNLISFKGVREDRNITEQLKKNNDYSLSENNQKKISKAIENLGKNSGEKNVEFLLDVAENLQYGSNIDSGAEPRNNWKLKLKNAVLNSVSISDSKVKEKYEPKIERLFSTKKPLSPDEQEILLLKGKILQNLDKSQLEDEKNFNIKNVEGNLNSFIASSETPLIQKKYILNRLEYFLSPDYEINPQLENKKTVVLAEILNDLVVNTNNPNSKFPNTKAINQKSHGMCAAISIARKLMSYEYKDKYVDSVLSELDSSDTMLVYDIADFGKNKKVPVQKTFIDYEDALSKGYRIVDASTTQWMNIADMSGINNKSDSVYNAFDRAHFGTFTDTHYFVPFENPELQAKQSYYQALIQAKKNIDRVKIQNLERKEKYFNKHNRMDSDIKEIQDLNKAASAKIKKIVPSLSDKEVQTILKQLLNLQKPYSSKIDKIKDENKQYYYIVNEEDVIKNKKLKSFFADKFKGKTEGEISDKNIAELRDLLEMSNSVAKSLNLNSSLSKQISGDRKLFEAAAAYRTSMIMALYDDDLKTDSMIHYNVADVESYLSDTIGKYIQLVKNGDKTYINHFSQSFGVKPNKKDVLELLKNIKDGVDYTITRRFDDLYYVMGVNDRKTALLSNLQAIKNSLENGDKSTLRNLAIMLNMKKDKVKILNKLEEYEKILTANPTESQYREIFNKLGYKNQMQQIAETYEVLADAVKAPDDEYNAKIISRLKEVNGIDADASIEELHPLMMNIASQFNEISENFELIRNSMNVYDETGSPINSANPTIFLIKKMENEGKIIPAKELLKLQNRYDAIDKLRSEDEFSSRQGKISDPTLYKYTNGEKETLKKIKKSINMMKSDVNKEMSGILKEIRKPLEEHVRKHGVNSGRYWVLEEGSSGLYSTQQAKILQQLTDKPYQILENFDKAIDIIKNSPHSGISGTQVFHNQPGAHAQYIAEIAEKDGKDILFHDNTWGASEHENVWIDSENLMRTDYSDNRGGALGYITDEKWRNGNYVKNLLEKTGDYKHEKIESKQIRKLKKDDEDFKFALINDILVPGIDKKAEDTAAMIKDNLFTNEDFWVDSLEKQAGSMTLEQLKAAKFRIKSAGKFYAKDFEKIQKRIEKTPFNKGISTRAEFDALADDDPLKVVFEKVALDKSYEYIPIWKKLAKINSVKELQTLKEEQRKLARENFDYAFAKNPEILYAYALNKNKNRIIEILNSALQNNNLELSDKEKVAIIKNTAIYSEGDEKKLFNGSLENTINFMVNKMAKQFDEIVPHSENSQKAKLELVENLTKDLKQKLYFTKRDICKDTELHIAIQKYIDKKYNPQTDDEFVEIYRKLQDMSYEEFKKETSDVKDEDMAFKNITGYDMLVKFKATNHKVIRDIENLLYQKYLLNDIELSETSPGFQYKKLQKKVRSSYYKNGRTFDDLYSDFNSSLNALNYEKMFNKTKDEGFRKYNVMPAYPKIKVVEEDAVKESVNLINNLILQMVQGIRSKKINLYVYETTEEIDSILKNLDDNKKLSAKERQIINNIAGEFITNNFNDPGLSNSLDAASKILELEEKASAKDYKTIFQRWNTEVNALKKANPVSDVKDEIQADLDTLSQSIDTALKVDIPTKYRNIVREDINKIIQMAIKDNQTGYDANFEKRKIKQIFASHMMNANNKKVEDFYNELIISSQNIKKLKFAYQNNKSYVENIQHEKTIASVSNFINEFVSENNTDDFAEMINSLYENQKPLKRKEIDEILLKQVLKYTNATSEEISGSKSFKSLGYNVWKFNNSINTLKKYENNLQRNKNELENKINNFIDKNIEPDYRQRVAEEIKDFLANQINEFSQYQMDENKLNDIEEKFLQDYKKYNYLSNPTEVLDRYLDLCAADGEISKAKTVDEKKALISEKNLKKNYLLTSLAFASVVEMQEILMNATKLGNPALAAHKLKNYDSGFADNITGASITLADPQAIDYMVRKLILKNDFDTAVMFVEKLGLTDKFLKIEDDIIDVQKIKKKINKIANIMKVTNSQNHIWQNEIEKLAEFSGSSSDFGKKIDEAKQIIIKKTKNMPRQANVTIMLKSFDSVKQITEANPDLPKILILQQCMSEAQSAISSLTNEDIQEIQMELNDVKLIHDMISQLTIPEYRDAFAHKTSIDAKMEELNNYNNEILQKIIADAKSLEVEAF